MNTKEVTIKSDIQEVVIEKTVLNLCFIGHNTQIQIPTHYLLKLLNEMTGSFKDNISVNINKNKSLT